MNTVPQLSRVRVYYTARQCGRNVVNHVLYCSTPHHYKLHVYSLYPAWHLNFARCTIYKRSYMPSCCLRRLNKPLINLVNEWVCKYICTGLVHMLTLSTHIHVHIASIHILIYPDCPCILGNRSVIKSIYTC